MSSPERPAPQTSQPRHRGWLVILVILGIVLALLIVADLVSIA